MTQKTNQQFQDPFLAVVVSFISTLPLCSFAPFPNRVVADIYLASFVRSILTVLSRLVVSRLVLSELILK